VTFTAHPPVSRRGGSAPGADTGLVPEEPVVGEAVAPSKAGTEAPGTGSQGERQGEGIDFRLLLEETIDAIRPALQADGGDMTLVGADADTGVVDIELIGACVGCPASTMTLKAGIERILKDRVPAVTAVNAVGLDPDLGP